jgi:hypothetical protein
MHKLNGISSKKNVLRVQAQEILWTPELSAFSLYLNFGLEYSIMMAQEN